MEINNLLKILDKIGKTLNDNKIGTVMDLDFALSALKKIHHTANGANLYFGDIYYDVARKIILEDIETSIQYNDLDEKDLIYERLFLMLENSQFDYRFKARMSSILREKKSDSNIIGLDGKRF
jgi:hypothetical protein